MEKLRKSIHSKFIVLNIELDDEKWNKAIPNSAGWYFLTTNTPKSVFYNLTPPPSEYSNEKGKLKKCRNYNLIARAESHGSEEAKNKIVIPESDEYAVYSGYAKKLKNRSREHTFAHAGTAGLALSNYKELKSYNWNFHYKTLDETAIEYENHNIVLKLGEQMWRSKYGWPLLCSA